MESNILLPKKKLRPAMAAFLGILLLLQTTLASLGAFAASAEGLQVVICDAGGLRTITLDSSGEEIPETPSHHADAECHFCLTGICLSAQSPKSDVLPLATGSQRLARPRSKQATSRHESRTGPIRAPPRTV
ncbi:DUF2946 family protein [Pseudohalocynthiibacter aestuariivivens]|uniref:DUF2946 family protein n=1 Tax=Pseudohalocynthiibacter aestuariivivens TaxID=1591409 RepID=A0ABV5JH63_9RHOB|nr:MULTISPECIES: DUF2946 family protein [Pseudohalocynthiibacter]MBS9718216.1 hypothetical protein [Pseudohalocynthiibacter aestuariivivens]MCK0103864.1 hypothetical protein [Pseudohalocynthiibacter sp. F2068]